jgi:predicted MPP superfamily phosphohydrolase
MVNKMIENLATKDKIDLVFFTGDLVYSGSKAEYFEKAHEYLFKKISEGLSIPISNFFICQGNHDIRREECSNAIIRYFDKEVSDNDILNDLYNKPNNDFKSSLKPSQNFYTYQKDNFVNNADELSELYTIQQRIINERKIAIVTLNTSWLSSGNRDINNLMLPTDVLKNAIQKINDADCKAILLHHPLSYFKEFNGIEIEDLIHKEFNLMFSGHIHREQIAAKFAGNNGIYTNTTQATLTFDKNGEIGFSIISYDFNEDGQIILERASYNHKEIKFVDLPSVIVHIPCGHEKASQNKLRRKITSKFRVELDTANDLLLDNDDTISKGFLELFTKPVLTRKNETETVSKDSESFFNFEQIYDWENHYLLFGRDKCGKTSLLKKIQLHLLKNFSLIGKVPFYFDYKELEKYSTIDIKKIIRNYYEIQNNDVEKIVLQGNLVMLIDNLNTNSPVNKEIIKFLEDNKNVKFVICSDYLASRIYFEELDHLEYKKIFFQDLSRKEIRLYTEKHPSIKQEDKEKVLDKITTLCQQLQLPINYWTVSIILLIYKRSNDDYNKNLFGILDLCVDEILQKKQLLVGKSKLTFEQYKEICGSLAHYLLTKYKDDIYSASSAAIISFLENLTEKNPRLVTDSKEIFDYLLHAGILKEKNGKFTFRLNGLFEYFLAFYIHQHPGFKSEILSNDSIYLSFKNELEIYSGFNRNDEQFLMNVFDKTKNVFERIINKYSEYGSLDDVLMQKLGEAQDFAERIKSLKVAKPLAHEIQDEIMDENNPLLTKSEVHLKEFIDANNITPEVLEIYLSILSRVYKNSDNIKNLNLVYEVFDYLLEAYCHFGYFLVDAVSDMVKNENMSIIEASDKSDKLVGEEMLKVITNFIPLLTEVLLYDGIGHVNLKTIIMKKIEEYKKDFRQNQYKLFLLYFLLIDTDIKTNKNYIDEVFQYITLSPLKVSTFFKLSFYLAFKAYQKKELEEFLKNKTRQAQLRMDNKTDATNMNRFLTKKTRGNIVRKGRNH